MAVKHTKVLSIPDGADLNIVRSGDGTASHTVEANTIGDAEIAAHTTTKITSPEARVTFDDAAGHSHTGVGATGKKVAHADLSGIGVNDHHARDHVLAGTVGLGGTDTVSGLTA